MYCMDCGQQLPDDANFCSKCGVPQKAGITAASPRPESLTLLAHSSGYRIEVVIERGTITQFAPGIGRRVASQVRIDRVTLIEIEKRWGLPYRIGLYTGAIAKPAMVIECDKKPDAEALAEELRDATGASVQVKY